MKLVIPEATKQHLLAHGNMVDLAQEVFDHHKKAGTLTPFKPICLYFHEIVGLSECRVTPPVGTKTIILVQKRKGRTKWSKATEMPPIPTNCVTIILNKDLSLITAYCGEPAPREPWDKSMNDVERYESIEFWSTHSLCLHEGAEKKHMTYLEFINGAE